MDISFRPGNLSDAEITYGFLKELVSKNHKFKLKYDDYHEHLAHPERGIKILMAEHDDVPVGMALWMERFSAVAGGTNLWLIELYVSPDYRSQGIGKKIFDELKNISKNNKYKNIEWFIASSNDDAKKFYEQMGGFEVTETERWRTVINK